MIHNGILKSVYCDQTQDGGGWLVIQRNMKTGFDFAQTWSQYKNGFGSLSLNLWLGNEIVHQLTWGKNYEILLTLKRTEGHDDCYAKYSGFKASFLANILS